MATPGPQRRTKRPREAEFEQVRGSKKVKLIWPISLARSISNRLEDAITDIKSSLFFRQTVNLNDAAGLDTSWHVHRFLGRGGFGTVALWEQRDEAGIVVDEIAIKDDRHVTQRSQDFDKPGDPTTSKEAMAQSTANTEFPENILHLRKVVEVLRHKVAYEDLGYWVRSVPRSFRHYLEYAPYGDLHGLMLRYKAFNRYLPELFLWHVFDSLATAICALDFKGKPPFTRMSLDYILHLDIKPQNILLGYEDAHDKMRIGGLQNLALQGDEAAQLPQYPSVKLADFGLAEFSHHDQRCLQGKDLQGIGTWGFRPPEQFRRTKDTTEPGVGKRNPYYGGDWNVTPYRNDISPPASFAMNIWAVGKVMLDLATLSGAEDFMEVQAETLEVYQTQNNNSMLPDFDTTPFRLNHQEDGGTARSPYTSALTSLIRDCMHADIEKRLSASQLKSQTRAQLAASRGIPSSGDALSVQKKDLYYRNNDVNILAGKAAMCRLPLDIHEFNDLFRPDQNDPDDPPIQISIERVINPPGLPVTILGKHHLRQRFQELERSRDARKAQRAWLTKSDLARQEAGKFWFRDPRPYVPEQSSDGESDYEPEKEVQRAMADVEDINDVSYEEVDEQVASEGKGENGNDEDDNDNNDDYDNSDDHYDRKGPQSGFIIQQRDGNLKLDLNDPPPPPPTAYEMFAEYTKNERQRNLSSEEIAAAADYLPEEHRAVFDRAYDQALRYHLRHHFAYINRPETLTLPRLDESEYPPNWTSMPKTRKKEWRARKKEMRGCEAYKGVLKRWRRKYRKKPPEMNRMLPLLSSIESSRVLWKELQYIDMDDEDVRGRNRSSMDRNLDARWDAMSDAQRAESLEYVLHLLDLRINLSNTDNTPQTNQDEIQDQADQEGESTPDPVLRSQEEPVATYPETPLLGSLMGGVSSGGYFVPSRSEPPPRNRSLDHVDPSRSPQLERKQSSVVNRQESQEQPEQPEQPKQQAPTAVPQQPSQQQHVPTGALAAAMLPGPQQPPANQQQPVGPPQQQQPQTAAQAAPALPTAPAPPLAPTAPTAAQGNQQPPRIRPRARRRKEHEILRAAWPEYYEIP